jgi:hypothetical protein
MVKGRKGLREAGIVRQKPVVKSQRLGVRESGCWVRGLKGLISWFFAIRIEFARSTSGFSRRWT